MKIALNIAKILVIGIILFGLYLSKYGLWPQYFEIEWKEEILLHDGRILMVDVKSQYERHGFRVFRYENVLFRKNTYTFDDSVHGTITLSTRLGVSYIDRLNGEWYAVLHGNGPYGNYPEEMPSHWGDDFTTSLDRLAKFDGKKFVPITWENAPVGEIKKCNMLIGAVPFAILDTFNQKTMTLSDKENLGKVYPAGAGVWDITRPLRMTQHREKK